MVADQQPEERQMRDAVTDYKLKLVHKLKVE